MLKFAQNVSPRKVAPPLRPARLFSGGRNDDDPNQSRSSANTTILSKSSSDFEDSSEPDIGDVTLPPSLQLSSNTKQPEVAHRITRLRVTGLQDACDTILEDGEDVNISQSSDTVSPTTDITTEKTHHADDGQVSSQMREVGCEVDNSPEVADIGICLPEPPSPSPGHTLRILEPLSPIDNNRAIRSPKKANDQKFLSSLRNPLASNSGEKENGLNKPLVNPLAIESLSLDSSLGDDSDSSRSVCSKPLEVLGKARRGALPSKRNDEPQIEHLLNQDGAAAYNSDFSPNAIMSAGFGAAAAVPSPAKGRKSPFEGMKESLAEEFLRQLDSTITEGKIAELAESTGGVKLLWTKSLNTTAGRANWKKETVRTTAADGAEINVQHNHHASIELAEKVIDSEQKLLNVMAHEFCHLANFMISGITNNPHGKEFKVWASKCSTAFGTRGVKVTTKHSYDIDFKYVWQCDSCSLDYKRHSKSINPDKHRCGGCKGKLIQIKPKPRNVTKPSEYQLFVKEQMQLLKQEYPNSPQKTIMRMAAERWSARPTRAAPENGGDVQQVVDKLLGMTIGED